MASYGYEAISKDGKIVKGSMEADSEDKVRAELKQQGLTLIPLSVYFKGSLVKVQLGLCRGKHLHDKRATAARRDANRTIDRALKEQNR